MRSTVKPDHRSTTARLTIVDATVAIQKGDQLEHTQVAVAFDAITTQAAARTAGRQIGEAMGEALALQLQQNRSLAS